MKITNHINLTKLNMQKQWDKMFQQTESGKQYKLIKIDHSTAYNLNTYTFNIEAKQTIPNLERKTIQQIYYGGITIKLTFSDNTFSIGIHKITIDAIYKDIRNMIIKQLALDTIEAQQLKDYIIEGFLSKQQFCILKPHKAIKDKWIDSNPKHIYINKAGHIAPIPLETLGIEYSSGIIKKLEQQIVKELMK